MLNNKISKGLLRVSAALLLGSFGAYAQQTPKTPAGEANDQTSPNAQRPPASHSKNTSKNPTGSSHTDATAPKTGEANEPGSPNEQRPPAKDKSTKKQSATKTKTPVTGEANDQTSNAGTTEAAKASKAIRPPTQ